MSTTWRYAMTRETDEDGEHFFTIREVYTSDDGTLSWTAIGVAARGDTWSECGDDLAKMGRAIGSPVLDISVDPPQWLDPRTLIKSKR